MTRITYAYSDTAPIYGEHRAYADLPADAREWWDDILARLQAVADRAAELGAERRDAIIAAGIDGDLEMAVIAQERALAAARAEGYRVMSVGGNIGLETRGSLTGSDSEEMVWSVSVYE